MARDRKPRADPAAAKLAYQRQRIVESWLARPKHRRTDDDLLKFYGWLSEQEPDLIPKATTGVGVYQQLRDILAEHVAAIEAAPSGNDLADAVITGDLRSLTALLDRDPDRLRETVRGRHLLPIAAEAGQTEAAKLLLERGADPTWRDADAPRGGALYHAARTGNRPLVELLLGHGADPNAHVESSGNALFAAARQPELRALLEAHGGTLDPYDLVWLDEDDEVLRRVTANPESAYDGCGGVYTAVVTREKRDLLMRLLDAGVRVPPKPDGCRSYLLEQPDMLRLLLARAGLDPDYTDEDGSTLLHALCRPLGRDDVRRRVESAAILLDAGATLSPADKDGATPLALARRNNLPEMAEFLASRGAA